jgi:hypothetical protein
MKSLIVVILCCGHLDSVGQDQVGVARLINCVENGDSFSSLRAAELFSSSSMAAKSQLFDCIIGRLNQREMSREHFEIPEQYLDGLTSAGRKPLVAFLSREQSFSEVSEASWLAMVIALQNAKKPERILRSFDTHFVESSHYENLKLSRTILSRHLAGKKGRISN